MCTPSASRKSWEFHNAGSRPYRSHKVRACDFCRKRKARCTVDLPDQPCFLCRMHGAECHHNKESTDSIESSIQRKRDSRSVAEQLSTLNGVAPPQKRAKFSQQTSADSTETNPETHDVHYSGQTRSAEKAVSGLKESLNESVHIIGPVAAKDAQVIEQFIPSQESLNSQGTKTPYNVYSNDPRKPILYTTVSRRRHGLRTTAIPGENQQEIIEQVVGPFKHDLVQMYICETMSVHSR